MCKDEYGWGGFGRHVNLATERLLLAIVVKMKLAIIRHPSDQLRTAAVVTIIARRRFVFLNLRRWVV